MLILTERCLDQRIRGGGMDSLDKAVAYVVTFAAFDGSWVNSRSEMG